MDRKTQVPTWIFCRRDSNQMWEKKEMVGGKLPRATMARRRHGANKGPRIVIGVKRPK